MQAETKARRLCVINGLRSEAASNAGTLGSTGCRTDSRGLGMGRDCVFRVRDSLFVFLGSKCKGCFSCGRCAYGAWRWPWVCTFSHRRCYKARAQKEGAEIRRKRVYRELLSVDYDRPDRALLVAALRHTMKPVEVIFERSMHWGRPNES